MRLLASFKDPLRCSSLILSLGAVLVPLSHRDEWIREWQAEIQFVWLALCKRSEPQAFRKLLSFALGCIADAWWCFHHAPLRERPSERLRTLARSAAFCLSAGVFAILLITCVSGFLPSTRDVLEPLPYLDASRIATASKSGISLSTRSGIPADWLNLWRNKSRLVRTATYRWQEEKAQLKRGRDVSVLHAEVSGDFFSVLSVGMLWGRPLLSTDATACDDCAVVSYELWKKYLTNTFGQRTIQITVGGRRLRIVGVLEKRFWFLSRRIGVWSLAGSTSRTAKSGVLIRLADGVTPQTAEQELEAILQADGYSSWESLVDVSILQSRVRSVLGSFCLALLLAFVMTAASLRFWSVSSSAAAMNRSFRNRVWRAAFFVGKTALLLTASLLAGIEFTRAASITMIGGTDVLTEPLSTWLFLLTCLGVLSWSIYDQRRRCPVCLKRLGLATHVGCSGCLLLDWAGTEMVCADGHGLLHIPEMLSSVHGDERWTAFVESWRSLFASKS